MWYNYIMPTNVMANKFKGYDIMDEVMKLEQRAEELCKKLIDFCRDTQMDAKCDVSLDLHIIVICKDQDKNAIFEQCTKHDLLLHDIKYLGDTCRIAIAV